MNEYADVCSENDRLKVEVERLKAELEKKSSANRILKKGELEKDRDRLRLCLEYIEMTGANLGHIDDENPCPCGGCMANAATKALQNERG